MSEDNTNETAIDSTATESHEEKPQGESTGTDWKAEARKWERYAKAAKADSEDASKWREYEASLKPIQEQLAEKLAETEAKAARAEASLLRYEVATEKGISGDATRLLKGSSREELEAEAELVLALIANQNKPKPPLPDENQGKPATSGVAQITDRETLKGMTGPEIMKAKAEGRLDSLLGKN